MMFPLEYIQSTNRAQVQNDLWLPENQKQLSLILACILVFTAPLYSPDYCQLNCRGDNVCKYKYLLNTYVATWYQWRSLPRPPPPNTHTPFVFVFISTKKNR
jgi:hypothetical protein